MRRFRLMPKIAAAIVSATMIFSGAVPAFAENTSDKLPITGGTISFDKKIVYDTNAHVPNVTFSYTIGYGEADTSKGIYAGDDSARVEITTKPSVGTATFTPNTNKETENTNNHVEVNSAQNVAKQTVNVDLTGIKFKRTGIYRFTLQEDSVSKKGLTSDTDPRYLDVYVSKNTQTNKYSVNSVLERQDRTTNKAKGDSFESRYTTFPVTFAKNIAGNQADPNDEFKFTLNISNADNGTIYDVYKGNDLITTMQAKADGTASYTSETVKASDVLTIRGIAEGTNVAVTEDDTVNKTLGYKPSIGDNTGNTATPTFTTDQYGITLTINGLTKSSTAVITNTKEGTVPTGVIFAVAPFAIGAVAIAAFVILKVRKAVKQ